MLNCAVNSRAKLSGLNHVRPYSASMAPPTELLPAPLTPARTKMKGRAAVSLRASIRRTGLGPFLYRTLCVKQCIEFPGGIGLLQHREACIEPVRQFIQRGLLARLHRLNLFSELLV